MYTLILNTLEVEHTDEGPVVVVRVIETINIYGGLLEAVEEAERIAKAFGPGHRVDVQPCGEPLLTKDLSHLPKPSL